MFLPVMDHTNNTVPPNKLTATQINKTIQRCLTKAIAMHGLGLFAFKGEDTVEQN